MLKLHKQIIVGAILTLASLLMWLMLKQVIFASGNVTARLIQGGTGILIFALVLPFFHALAQEARIKIAVIVIISGLFLLVFGWQWVYILGLIVLVVFWLISFARVGPELNDRLKFKFRRIITRGLPPVLTGLALLIALVCYFSSVDYLQYHYFDFSLPEQVYLWLEKPLQPLFSVWVKDFSFQMSLDDFLARNLGLDDNLTKQVLADPAVKSILVAKSKEQLGLDLSGQEPMSQVINIMLRQKINELVEKYQDFIPYGLAMGLFLTLKGLSFIFVLLSLLISGLGFKLLKKLAWIKVCAQPAQKQIISL